MQKNILQKSWNMYISSISTLKESIEKKDRHKKRSIWNSKGSLNLPGSYLRDLELFCARNYIPIKMKANGKTHSLKRVCMQCLKAHAVTKAREMKLPKKTIDLLSNSIRCEEGHGGYYMDGSRVRYLL